MTGVIVSSWKTSLQEYWKPQFLWFLYTVLYKNLCNWSFYGVMFEELIIIELLLDLEDISPPLQ